MKIVDDEVEKTLQQGMGCRGGLMNNTLTEVTERASHESDRYSTDEAVWWLHHELRGSLNALGLCLRVLESGPPDREAREYAKFVSEASQRIERLVAKLRPSRATA